MSSKDLGLGVVLFGGGHRVYFFGEGGIRVFFFSFFSRQLLNEHVFFPTRYRQKICNCFRYSRKIGRTRWRGINLDKRSSCNQEMRHNKRRWDSRGEGEDVRTCMSFPVNIALNVHGFLLIFTIKKKKKKKSSDSGIIVPDKIEPYNISLKENTGGNDLLLNTLPSVIYSILFSPTFSQHFQTHLLRLINNSQRTEHSSPPKFQKTPFPESLLEQFQIVSVSSPRPVY